MTVPAECPIPELASNELTELRQQLATIRDEIATTRSEAAAAHAAIGVVRWLVGLVAAAIIAWGAWMTVTVIRTQAASEETANELHEHRALPIHPGAADQLSGMRADVRELRVIVEQQGHVLDDVQQRVRAIELRSRGGR